MRVTSCPDCGEVVELPTLDQTADKVEVSCPTCGLSGPLEEWQTYAPADDDSLLGRPLAAATIPATVPRSWAIRIEQLEEIKDVVVELQYQIRLLRQALDEFNEDCPEKIRRWMAAICPLTPRAAAAPSDQAQSPREEPRPSPAKTPATKSNSRRKPPPHSPGQSALWS